MTAVLILAGSKAFSVSASAVVLLFGIVIAAMLSALAQWIASAKTKRDTVTRLVLIGAVPMLAIIAYDCGRWWWLWCAALI